jgi:hypothetical protein
MEPLDRSFNIAVLHIAGKLCPGGYDVSDDAPDTYPKLRAHLDRTKQMLVWSGGSENTIYGEPEVNWAFRAWHDWCHYRGAHDFTPEGERAVFEMQRSHLLLFYGDCAQTQRWIKILRAEVIGQQKHFYKHGYYPYDQRAFVEAYLNEPQYLQAAE